MRYLLLIIFTVVAACAIIYSVDRDMHAFDEHVRVQDSLDVVNKVYRDSIESILRK